MQFRLQTLNTQGRNQGLVQSQHPDTSPVCPTHFHNLHVPCLAACAQIGQLVKPFNPEEQILHQAQATGGTRWDRLGYILSCESQNSSFPHPTDLGTVSSSQDGLRNPLPEVTFQSPVSASTVLPPTSEEDAREMGRWLRHKVLSRTHVWLLLIISWRHGSILGAGWPDSLANPVPVSKNQMKGS